MHLKFNILISLVFFGTVAIGAAPLFGQVAKVAPITAFERTSEGLRASFQLPCSTRFLGIVASQIGEVLELGVAYTSDLLRCANLPKPESVNLAWLNPDLARSVRPLTKLRGNGIWRMTSGLVIENSIKPNRTAIDFVYPSACGRSALPVFRNENSGVIEIAALEYFPSSPIKECQAVEKQIHLSKLVQTSDSVQYQSYSRPVRDLHRAYFVSLVKVLDFSIVRQAGHGVSVSFRRRCNEVPIGLIMSALQVVDGRRHAGVGVLVGRYYNASCPVSSPSAGSIEHLRVSALEFSTDIVLSSIDPAQYSRRLRLRSPAVSELVIRGQYLGISMDYVSDCSKQIGAVYHFLPGEALSVGVLEDVSNARCKGDAKRVSLLQPFMDRVDRGTLAPVYPLRLEGLSER